jgi:hypothetical protein
MELVVHRREVNVSVQVWTLKISAVNVFISRCLWMDGWMDEWIEGRKN